MRCPNTTTFICTKQQWNCKSRFGANNVPSYMHDLCSNYQVSIGYFPYTHQQ